MIILNVETPSCRCGKAQHIEPWYGRAHTMQQAQQGRMGGFKADGSTSLIIGEVAVLKRQVAAELCEDCAACGGAHIPRQQGVHQRDGSLAAIYCTPSGGTVGNECTPLAADR